MGCHIRAAALLRSGAQALVDCARVGKTSLRRRVPATMLVAIGAIGAIGVGTVAIGVGTVATPAALASSPHAATVTAVTQAPPPPLAPIPGTFGVGYAQTTFVDPIDGGRSLVTEIRYPTLPVSTRSGKAVSAPATALGPFPVIVFAHGYNVTPDTYAALLDSWVETGFVVVAPLFPGENEYNVSSLGGPTSAAGSAAENDVYNEPYDLSYLIGALAQDFAHPAAGTAGVLHGLADPRRLILAGQSDGADAVAALAYDSYYSSAWSAIPAADRPQVVAIFEGAEFGLGRDQYGGQGGRPLAFVVQSATDACNPPQDSTQLYNAVGQPKLFLELSDATHLGPYDGSASDAPLVEQVTAGLYRRVLGDLTPRMTGIEARADVTGVADLTASDTAPQMTPLSSSPAACAPPS